MHKKAEKIIALLPNTKEYIEELGIDSQKIVWISNSVDLEQFDKPKHFISSSETAQAFRK